ncbi:MULTISPECIES: flagellar export chaperone FliS [Pseudoxanthomonas]|jgi:flagellar biosynthetic protein FliS|uniref:Flagellar secretion chaperone FliS n=1 Tax=Pseudoxanthomonas taiwanensis J19 TaxID=935569 RepID=A0A562E2I3_9GAMM|nr:MULTISPECIES: flagellar export chaperone FliS [Pseudoxanthomonas]RRN81039.1 flagellar export chaperone FliS [Pseudoxanthomonas sp. SGD-10]TWH16166.1 flagellar protein FliS [Pseudoxanthomonas taiwanensis J19]
MDQFGYGSYQSVGLSSQTASASPVQLVLVLLDGLADELARVRAHIEARRYEAKGQGICKCIDLITALSSSLDFELGGEPVADLGRLYEYMILRINEAGIAMDAAMVEEVSATVETLRQAWRSLEARGP